MNKNIVYCLLTCIILIPMGCKWPAPPSKPLINGYQPYTHSTEKPQIGHPQNEQSGRNINLPINSREIITWAKPQVNRQEIILRRKAYTTAYDPINKIPYWVGWQLTAEHTNGTFNRKGIKFTEDNTVPTPRATDMDYRRSGFDRGHMCPSGDNKWDPVAQQESFLVTNICPQHPNINAGDWNELEELSRKWARKHGKIYIISGPILYEQKHKTIGKNKVTVPEAFFKIIICLQGKPKGIGFIVKNRQTNQKLTRYINTIDRIERITGTDFFPDLSPDIQNKIESTADISQW